MFITRNIRIGFCMIIISLTGYFALPDFDTSEVQRAPMSLIDLKSLIFNHTYESILFNGTTGFNHYEVEWAKGLSRNWPDFEDRFVRNLERAKTFQSWKIETQNQQILAKWADRLSVDRLEIVFKAIVGIIVSSNERYTAISHFWAKSHYKMDRIQFRFYFFTYDSTIANKNPNIFLINSTINDVVDLLKQKCIECDWLVVINDRTILFQESLAQTLTAIKSYGGPKIV